MGLCTVHFVRLWTEKKENHNQSTYAREREETTTSKGEKQQRGGEEEEKEERCGPRTGACLCIVRRMYPKGSTKKYLKVQEKANTTTCKKICLCTRTLDAVRVSVKGWGFLFLYYFVLSSVAFSVVAAVLFYQKNICGSLPCLGSSSFCARFRKKYGIRIK